MKDADEFRSQFKCPISGATQNLRGCALLPARAAEENEENVACKEWLFGLPRGGLSYYIKSRENTIYFRDDIAKMYLKGDFILAPTFKLYQDLMEFILHAGVVARQDIELPRRPLTALASPEGLYRYVLIPRTEAGTAFLKEFDLPRQTEEDLCGGIHPLLKFPLVDGCTAFSVVECCAHPFSVCAMINKSLRKSSTHVTGQWRMCVRKVVDQWKLKLIKPPQWFIDAPKIESYDEELPPSEATGYDPCVSEGLVALKPDSVLRNAEIPEDDFRKGVARWACKVDPKSKPEEDPPHVLYKLRRSKRLQKKPYDPPSPDLPPPSPVRNGPRAARAARRDLVRQPPPWERSYGRFPTDTFTSNDWAYFNYHVALGAPVES